MSRTEKRKLARLIEQATFAPSSRARSAVTSPEKPMPTTNTSQLSSRCLRCRVDGFAFFTVRQVVYDMLAEFSDTMDRLNDAINR